MVHTQVTPSGDKLCRELKLEIVRDESLLPVWVELGQWIRVDTDPEGAS